MNEEVKREAPAISLLDFWNVFRRYWLILLVVALFASGFTTIYLYQTHSDVYSAKGSLWVLREKQSASTQTSDVSISNNLIYDVADTIVSNDVLKAALEVTGSQKSIRQLNSMIKVEPVPGETPTHIVKFSVSGSDPQEVQKLAVALVDCVCEKMDTLFNGEKYVKPWDSVAQPTAPSNPIRHVYIPTVGLLAALIAYVIFIVLHFFDGRIDSESALKYELNLILLGEIPNLTDAKRSRNKYGHYSRYYAAKKEDKKQ